MMYEFLRLSILIAIPMLILAWVLKLFKIPTKVLYIYKIFTYIVCSLAVLGILIDYKYIDYGEVASQPYYTPLNYCDYVVIALNGCLWSALSVSQNVPVGLSDKITKWVIGLIFGLLVIGECIIGDDVIQSRDVDWPDCHKVRPYNQIESLGVSSISSSSLS